MCGTKEPEKIEEKSILSSRQIKLYQYLIEFDYRSCELKKCVSQIIIRHKTGNKVRFMAVKFKELFAQNEKMK